MSRLIDADALWMDVIHAMDYCDDILEIIDNQPTVGERKVGKWIRVPGYCTPGGDPVWACSECGKGEHVFGIEHRSYGAKIADNQWVSCPNCGARMEGEER